MGIHRHAVTALRAALGPRYDAVRSTAMAGPNALAHRRAVAAIGQSPLFDDAFYAAAVGITGTRDELAAHLLAHGAPAGRSPHPLIDIERLPAEVRGAWHAGDVAALCAFAETPASLAHRFSTLFAPGTQVPTARTAREAFAALRADPDLPLRRLPDGAAPAPADPAARVGWRRARAAAIEVAASIHRADAHAPLELVEQRADVEDAAWLAAHRDAPASEATVSIVMPVRNRPHLVRTAIASVQAQTHLMWQLLVVDDGSDDDTPTVLAELAAGDDRIRVIRQEQSGVSAARNAGLAAATGDAVAFLDSDNTWTPTFLALMLAGMRSRGADAAFSSTLLRTADGDRYRGGHVDYESLLQANSIDLNCLLVRRDLAARTGGFDTSLRRWVDHDFALKLAELGDIAHLPFVGVEYDDSTGPEHRITTRESHHWQFAVLERAFARVAPASPEPVPGTVSAILVVAPDTADASAALRAIDALRREASVTQVLVIDNASPATTALALAMGARDLPDVEVIRLARDAKRAVPRNIALRRAHGEFTLVCEPGLAAAEGWVERLRATLVDDGLDGVQPLVVDTAGVVQHAGAQLLATRTTPAAFLDGHPVADAVRHGGGRTLAVADACALWRTDTLRGLGGFDPLFVDAQWQADACLRAGDAHFAVDASTLVTLPRCEPGPSAPEDERLFVARWGEHATTGGADYARLGLRVAHLAPSPQGHVGMVTPVTVRADGGAPLRWRLRLWDVSDAVHAEAAALADALRADGDDAFCAAVPDAVMHLDDVVVAVRGAARSARSTGRVNVLWVTPGCDADVDDAERALFDAVVDGPLSAAALRALVPPHA